MYLITGLADLHNTLAYVNGATLGQGQPRAFIHHMEGVYDEANFWPCRAGSVSTGLDEKARLRKLRAITRLAQRLSKGNVSKNGERQGNYGSLMLISMLVFTPTTHRHRKFSY